MWPASPKTESEAPVRRRNLAWRAAAPTALPGREDESRHLPHTLAPATRAESGCLGFEVFHTLDEPALFAIHECWATPAAMNTHRRTEHTTTFRNEAGALLDAPGPRPARPID